MSRRLLLILLLCVLAVAGCKKQRQDLAYYHPHKSFSVWEEDLDHCHHSVSALKKSGRLLADSYSEGVEQCMQAKGYVYGYRPYPLPPSAEGMSYAPEGSVFTLLDSTWHSTKLAQKRAAYLEDTGVWSATVRSWDSGTAGIWQQVLVGTYDSIYEAREARDKLVRSHGLNDLRIVLR